MKLLILTGDVEENPWPDTEMAAILKNLQVGKATILSELGDIENRQTNLDGLISDFGSRIESLESKMQAFEHTELDKTRVYNTILLEMVEDREWKLDNWKTQSRRRSLIFYGIVDRNTRESWETTETSMKGFCLYR